MPNWLNETELKAWRSLVAVMLVGMPELERTFRRHGLVHIEYGLLAALSDNPEGLRLSALANQVNMSPSRLSHRMRKLVELGYVEVSGHECDGRVSIARITEEGLAFAARVAPEHVDDVRRVIFDGLTPGQVAALADALGTIAGNLTDCPRGPRAAEE